MIVKTKDVIDLFDVTAQTLGNWKKRGLRQEKRGRWDLKKVLEWWFLNVAPDKLAENSGTLADARKFFLDAKGQREKLKLQVERGELIKKADVEKEAFECARTARDALLNIPSRVSSVLAAKTKEVEVEKILDKEIRQALEALSK